MNQRVAKLIKEALFHSPFRRFAFPRYIYEFTPAQLCFLCKCLEDTRGIEGAVFEVGCNVGATTVFLNKYMDATGIEKPYYAIDTFSGFVQGDVDYEVANRRKSKAMYTGRFTANKKKWFDETLRQHGVKRVQSIEGDVNELDLTSLGPVSFALLDVDLYKPMRKALAEVYAALVPGGIIVVDDCDTANERWDGSHQAYREHMAMLAQVPSILHRKLGVLMKPVSAAVASAVCLA